MYGAALPFRRQGGNMNRILSHAIAAALFAGLSSTQVLADDTPIERGSLKITTYDGVTDDLLSAGLNQAQLESPTLPAFVDQNNPTADELRRRAIYNTYRAIVDPVRAGGMGLLWGPALAPAIPGATPGLI